MFSLFMQLNDGESDLMASFEEVELMMNFIQPLKDEAGNVTLSRENRAKQAFEKYQSSSFLDFRQF